MANRQRIPSWGLSGAMAKRPVAAQITHPAQRFIASETGAYTDSVLLNTANMLADKMHKTETERLAMQADVSLKATRQALENAQSPDQLRDMVKNNDKVLAAQFDGDKKTQDFWRNHGDKILAANQADTQKIIAQKQIDFGKQSLNSMLADNQNLLAETQDELKAEKLLQMGNDEIQNTPFLNDNDKDTYRQGYLKTGILNLALHNPDAADKAVDTYFDDDTLKSTLKAQIQQTKAIMILLNLHLRHRYSKLKLLMMIIFDKMKKDKSSCLILINLLWRRIYGKKRKGAIFLRRNIMCCCKILMLQLIGAILMYLFGEMMNNVPIRL